jgi:FtsP/CotA-like multicopper oxidase with cupredoxin domain
MPTRREFLKTSGIAGATLILYGKFGAQRTWALAQSPGLRKFQDLGGNPISLRGLGPGGIPVAVPDGIAPVTGAAHYTMDVRQFTDRLHPDLPNLTTLWGFNPLNALGGNGAATPAHLGGVIVAQKGVPLQITFRNNLPPSHIIPVDTTLMGADLAQNRASVHLHGGFTPWISDGGPFAWFAPDGSHGASFVNNQVLNPSAAINEADYYYTNDQSARLLWYHDHAIGITRINAYAGIASAYVIRDSFEGELRNLGLPDFVENGGREIPIVIQDKVFVPANVSSVDPTWTGPSAAGSLWYAHVYDPKLYTLHGNKKGDGAVPTPSAVPEFFGDTMLANGTVYPETTVEARRYRLRILNACNARFLNLQLYVDDGSPDSITLNPLTLAPTNAKGPDYLQIGTEGGFLPNPVLVPSNVPFDREELEASLLLAPAERADIIIDFSGFAGQKLVLYNDAPAPFPDGEESNDYFPNAPANPTITTPGFGPNTRQIMRFNVIEPISADSPLNISPATDLTAGNDPLLVPLGVTTPPPGVFVRSLTLNETFDSFGRLIQLLGTNVPPNNRGHGFGRGYVDSATETPANGDIEVWQIVNLTGDTHPIHFHLVNVQIISRQPFRVSNYNGTPSYTAPAQPPDLSEAGWKDTVRMNPGEVTTVIMQFKLPAVPFAVPSSPRVGGNEYVWHCHILEHEEHDMMRPLVVL